MSVIKPAKLVDEIEPPAGEPTRTSRGDAEAAVRTLIGWIGDDPDREGLAGTPTRVVRAFEDDELPHPDGKVDPARDVANVDLELILADLELLERRLEGGHQLRR